MALDLISSMLGPMLRRDDEVLMLLCIHSRQPRSLPAADLSQIVDIMPDFALQGSESCARSVPTGGQSLGLSGSSAPGAV